MVIVETLGIRNVDGQKVSVRGGSLVFPEQKYFVRAESVVGEIEASGLRYGDILADIVVIDEKGAEEKSFVATNRSGESGVLVSPATFKNDFNRYASPEFIFLLLSIDQDSAEYLSLGSLARKVRSLYSPGNNLRGL